MAQFHREAYHHLYGMAEPQQGFYTAKQAKAAGFAENTHPYHVGVVDWIREYRGFTASRCSLRRSIPTS